jgi:3-methyladenine DNA glycosylase Tag
MVDSFQPIIDQAAANKDGLAALEEILPKPALPEGLSAIPDHRWLSMMTKRIFQSSFVWSVVEAKWDEFETAFEGFEPRRLAMYADEELDRLIGDAGIIRKGVKIRSAIENARFLVDLADEYGAAGAFFANWPDADYISLLGLMKKRGNRFGGNTSQYVLRSRGSQLSCFPRT